MKFRLHSLWYLLSHSGLRLYFCGHYFSSIPSVFLPQQLLFILPKKSQSFLWRYDLGKISWYTPSGTFNLINFFFWKLLLGCLPCLRSFPHLFFWVTHDRFSIHRTQVNQARFLFTCLCLPAGSVFFSFHVPHPLTHLFVVHHHLQVYVLLLLHVMTLVQLVIFGYKFDFEHFL